MYEIDVELDDIKDAARQEAYEESRARIGEQDNRYEYDRQDWRSYFLTRTELYGH